MTTTVRLERAGDEDAIAAVTREAFRFHPHGDHTEHRIIDALRRADALAISLVAEQHGVVVGHVAFSPVAIADGSSDWYGLGPLSVHPACQRQGVGQALVREGLARLHTLGAGGCVLLGEPSFYGRFGFANDPGLVLDGLTQEFFLALPLGSAVARGEVTYHAAFNAGG